MSDSFFKLYKPMAFYSKIVFILCFGIGLMFGSARTQEEGIIGWGCRSGEYFYTLEYTRCTSYTVGISKDEIKRDVKSEKNTGFHVFTDAILKMHQRKNMYRGALIYESLILFSLILALYIYRKDKITRKHIILDMIILMIIGLPFLAREYGLYCQLKEQATQAYFTIK